MINKYITLLTFIPWILIFVVSALNALKDKNYQMITRKYVKDNIFKIFRADTLLLVIAFFYFSSFNKEFVSKYLFAVMCLYLFVNSFYEKKNEAKKNFYRDNIANFIITFIVMIIPFLVYVISGKLILTYRIMLLYLFFINVIIVVVLSITRNVKKILKK